MAWPDFTYDVWEDCLDGSLAAGLAETDVGSCLTISSATQQLGGENTMEIVTDAANPAHINYASVNSDVVSLGFWFRSGSYANWSGGPIILELRNVSYGLQLYLTDEKSASTNARQIKCLANTGPSQAAGIVAVSDYTWYWITLQFNRNGTLYWRVYNEAHALVGSEQSFSTLANYAVSTIYYGEYVAYGTAGKYIYFKNFVVDKTDGTYPLYGWETGAAGHPTLSRFRNISRNKNVRF